jgi:hypothetical protein
MPSADLKNFHVIWELCETSEARRILVLRRKDGRYCFAEQSLLPPAPEDEVHVGRWMTNMMSRLYPTAEDAERDARRYAPWMQIRKPDNDAGENPWTR